MIPEHLTDFLLGLLLGLLVTAAIMYVLAEKGVLLLP